ncbi:MAG: hypothetical protein IPK97_13270 [Ahniella sp.]|jgi:hypothetical protein|nr:hypothetical protein [Ahniella sp.]
MLEFAIKEQGDKHVVCALKGTIASRHLEQLSQILISSLARGVKVQFDMTEVASMEPEAIRFFTEGLGRAATTRAPDSGRTAAAEI